MIGKLLLKIYLNNNIDKYIVPSEYIKNIFKQVINKNKIIVIPNGIQLYDYYF